MNQEQFKAQEETENQEDFDDPANDNMKNKK